MHSANHIGGPYTCHWINVLEIKQTICGNKWRGHRHSYCCCLATKLCPTLCDPMDCSPPGSSVHGISQAGKLAWVSIAISSSRGSSGPRDWIHSRLCVSSMGRRILYHCATREARQPFVLLDIFALHLLHFLQGTSVYIFFLFCSLIIHFFGCHFLNWSVIDISI